MKAFLGDYYKLLLNQDTQEMKRWEMPDRLVATQDKMLHPKKISLTKKKRLEYAELRSDV